jgi:hypothetical protein
MDENTRVGTTRLAYDHGIYTTLSLNGAPRDYFVVQCFSEGAMRRQLHRLRTANRERVYWSTDENVK